MLAEVWESVKLNFDLLIWKWNQAMKNHAKNGERNVYAEELLLYVLYVYAAIGVIIIFYCVLVYFGYAQAFPVPNRKSLLFFSQLSSSDKKTDNNVLSLAKKLVNTEEVEEQKRKKNRKKMKVRTTCG